MKRGVDAGLVVALTLVAAAMGPLAAFITDSGRDLAWGYAIAHGVEFPLYGPGLFDTWKPGPLWFYLLAVPIALTKSLGATALFVSVLAAMKIPLAHALGARARGAALGLAFAAFVAFPGWSTLGQLVLSHTSLVEATLVATLWLCLVAVQRGSARLAALAVAMQAIAIHAHPTTLVAAPAVAWAVWTCVLRTRRWGWLALAAAGFVLPFLPALVAEARAGWPQLGGSAAYFGGGDYLARADRIGDLLIGAVHGQAVFVREFLLARWPWVGVVVYAGALLAAAVGGAGVVVGLVRERLLPAVLVMAALGWLFVALLRDATPAWMAYAPLVLLSASFALGWHTLWPERWRANAARALAAFALLASGAVLAERFATVRDGLQSLPTAGVGDIALRPRPAPPPRFWLPAWAHDVVFARLCAAPGTVSLHGDLAVGLHFAQGVAAALHCDDTAHIGFGGQSPRTLVGIPRALAGSLGLAGEATSYGFVLATPARVVHPATRRLFATHTRYLVEDYRALGDARMGVPVRTACEAREVLAITDLVPGFNAPFEIVAVDDPLPALLGETIATRYYACPANGAFSLDVIAREADAVGVVLLRR